MNGPKLWTDTIYEPTPFMNRQIYEKKKTFMNRKIYEQPTFINIPNLWTSKIY